MDIAFVLVLSRGTQCEMSIFNSKILFSSSIDLWLRRAKDRFTCSCAPSNPAIHRLRESDCNQPTQETRRNNCHHEQNWNTPHWLAKVKKDVEECHYREHVGQVNLIAPLSQYA